MLLPLLPPEVWAALCSRSLLELPGASSTQAGLWSCGPLPSSAAVSVSLGGRPHPPATPSPPSWPVLDGPRGPRAVPAAPAVPPGCVPPSSLPGEEGGADPELSELGPPQGCCPPPAPSPLCEAQCSRWVRAGNKTTRVCEPSVSGRGRGGGGNATYGSGRGRRWPRPLRVTCHRPLRPQCRRHAGGAGATEAAWTRRAATVSAGGHRGSPGGGGRSGPGGPAPGERWEGPLERRAGRGAGLGSAGAAGLPRSGRGGRRRAAVRGCGRR